MVSICISNRIFFLVFLLGSVSLILKNPYCFDVALMEPFVDGTVVDGTVVDGTVIDPAVKPVLGGYNKIYIGVGCLVLAFVGVALFRTEVALPAIQMVYEQHINHLSSVCPIYVLVGPIPRECTDALAEKLLSPGLTVTTGDSCIIYYIECINKSETVSTFWYISTEVYKIFV